MMYTSDLRGEKQLCLTEEQREIASANHNLVYSFLHKNNLNIEDWYDIISIGYCKGICTYSGTKGSALSTYCWACMVREYVAARAHSSRKRRSGVAIVSLDIDYADSDNNGLHDYITDGSSLEDSAVDVITFRQWMQTVKKEYLAVINWKLEGLSSTEIGKRFGCGRANISRILIALKKDYLNFKNKATKQMLIRRILK